MIAEPITLTAQRRTGIDFQAFLADSNEFPY